MQALALLPGISRSGTTIAAGLHEGLDRGSAGTFAFLLAIPAIGGAGLIEIAKLARQVQQPGMTESTSPLMLVVGGLVAMFVGWLALGWLVRWIQAGRLGRFAWYLIPLGIAVVAWQLWN